MFSRWEGAVPERFVKPQRWTRLAEPAPPPYPATMHDPAPYTTIDAATAPAFSADGRTLFYLQGAGLPQAWALDLDSGATRQLTQHDEKVALLRRAPGDDRLIYGIDAGGDERQQLWLHDGTPRALTTAPEVIHGFGAWHPDGQRFSLTANDRDPAHFDVLIQDVATGARTRIYQGRHELTLGPWNKDGTRLIATADHATGDQRPMLLDEAGAAHAIPRAGNTSFASLRWDGDLLMGLTDSGGRDMMALCRIDPATGSATPLFAPYGRDVEAWALSAASGLLATIENDRGYARLRVGPLDGTRAEVTGLPNGIAAELAWSPDGRRLAFAASAPDSTWGLYLWEDGAVRPVLQPACELPLTTFTLVGWASFDGRHIPGWLALPAGAVPPGGHPAVVWVHGGPANQARAVIRPDMQALLAQGYAVLMPNMRGSSGYGRASMASDDREKRLDSVHDLAAARHFLAAQPGIDPSRIAVMGQSYGGYMVLAAITEYPELWQAAIDLYGIADFVTLLDSTGPWRRAHRSEEYGDPVRHRALFDRISPIHHMGRVRVPLLVLHGTRDPRVAIGESEQVVAALRGAGKPVTYEVFDYAGHGFIRPDDKLRVVRAVSSFLRAHL